MFKFTAVFLAAGISFYVGMKPVEAQPVEPVDHLNTIISARACMMNARNNYLDAQPEQLLTYEAYRDEQINFVVNTYVNLMSNEIPISYLRYGVSRESFIAVIDADLSASLAQWVALRHMLVRCWDDAIATMIEDEEMPVNRIYDSQLNTIACIKNEVNDFARRNPNVNMNRIDASAMEIEEYLWQHDFINDIERLSNENVINALKGRYTPVFGDSLMEDILSCWQPLLTEIG